MIRGRVVRADTGEPLRRVQVRVDEWSTGDRSGPAATMTDAEGRYELTQLPAGRYQLKATRGGYVEVAYGQRRPFERGRPLELGEGAVLQNIDFALPPGAVVTGRVVDETGEAVARVSVSLERRRYIDGARRLVGGERQLHGRPRGVQDLRRAARRLRDRREVRRDGPGLEGSRAVRANLLPGTPVASEAQRVTVGAGQEVPGITIALARAATATVRGVVRSSGQASPGPFTFVTAREISGPQAYGQPAMAIAGCRRIVRDRRTASGHLHRGGAITVRVGVRVEGGRRPRGSCCGRSERLPVTEPAGGRDRPMAL